MDTMRPLTEFDSHGLIEEAEVSARNLIGACARVVVCAPHPDDEVLGCGGLMAMCVGEGIPVVIVSVTDGEACYPDHPVWTPSELRAARRMELCEALAALGLPPRAVRRLAFPDGNISERISELACALTRVVRPGDALFVTARFDGHPDHEACAQAARQATDAVGNCLFQYPIWAGHLAPVEEAVLHGLTRIELSLPGFARHRKAQSMDCFATQTGKGACEIQNPILPPTVCERFLGLTETYYR